MKYNLPKEVEGYLSKFEFKKYELYAPLNKTFNNIIVIPAIAEFENIKNLINSLHKNSDCCFDNTLVLFVVNNLKSAELNTKDENLKTVQFLKTIIEKNTIGLTINFVDACTVGNELPEKDGGVGLARKIGMDIALRYFDYSHNTLLVCLDSDCLVSENYFTVLNNYRSKGIAAGYVPFIHRFTENEEENYAIICYDLFLHYYVAGLKYSQSPYAFHTIGSAMVCSAGAYCKIQGMNKRLAAEDFYFMEKLAKLYPITVLKEGTVFPLGRSSWRVPFGTGQRVARYLTKIQDEYILYNTMIFEILNKWNDMFFYKDVLSSKEYLEFAFNTENKLYDFLVLNNFKESWDKILSSSNNSLQIYKQKKFWFDGFRTLKLVHYLRDNGYPNLKMIDALNNFNKLIGVNYSNNFITKNEQLKYLELLKEYITS